MDHIIFNLSKEELLCLIKLSELTVAALDEIYAVNIKSLDSHSCKIQNVVGCITYCKTEGYSVIQNTCKMFETVDDKADRHTRRSSEHHLQQTAVKLISLRRAQSCSEKSRCDTAI